ncbi:hypothetical protein CDLVIII_3453 [Clostridium sp. DL-VIII]|uniref:hypothetical protein n=1 Tax=Clostridium sp. DL-VIII TaxID=641107 RepID=UPI00023AFA05|nr:hypothetical protein [Clostridium sp. DL-VIII]EHJ00014.1 hypothetical protein CDLVIII_3453 [Clostridium sp. DL-VIII]
MRRKFILAFMLFSILLFSISLFGCGDIRDHLRNRTNFTRLDTTDGANNNNINTPRGGNGNNSANLQDGTNGSRTNTGGSSTGSNGTGTNNTGATDGTNNMQFATDTMKYGPENFKNDISNAGYKVIELPNSKVDYFKGNETDYKLGGDTVRLYEYNTVGDLDADINRISSDGMTISGTKANYTATNKPHYYRKGNTLIVYEGNEPAYIDEFGRLYGNTLRP